MSRRKAAARSTMTLKDFHGGSIPSDLPLPSAPGMTVERSIYERQGSGTWTGPTLGRGVTNDRSGFHRHGSSGGVRTFEDKSAYFPNPANIGRNYDEDERKPVDNRPRSSHSADRFDDHPTYEERRLGSSGDSGGSGGGGGHLSERYSFESQGALGNAPNFASEIRSPGGASDRFPPSSQPAAGGFQKDISGHDDFGLIPVGPPPRMVPDQESGSRPQPPSSYQQRIASSPPRSWRNASHLVRSSSALALSPSQSTTNVWTARRDGDLRRSPEIPSSSSSWQPQSTSGRALDNVSSGRWQSDASRHLGASDRRQQFASPVSEQGGETVIHPRPTGTERSLSDASQRYEIPRIVSGQGMQPSEPIQGFSDESGRMSSFLRATLSQAGRSGRLETDPAESSEERIGRFATARHDNLRLSHGEDFGAVGDSGRRRSLENLQIGHSDAGGGFENPGSETTDLTKPGHINNVNRVLPFKSPGGGQGFTLAGTRGLYSDRSRCAESGEGSSALIDGGSNENLENGVSLPGAELGRQLSSSRLTVPVEQSAVMERPKLKLLPRSKPLENSNVEDNEAGRDATGDLQPPVKLTERHRKPYSEEELLALGTVFEKNLTLQEAVSKIQDIPEDAVRKAERPRLNLKPRSQCTEEAGEGSQRVRQSLFGGARPRELVLKERGVDDILGSAERGQTPVTPSLPSSAALSPKWEANDAGRAERTHTGAAARPQSWRHDRQEKSHALDSQESWRRPLESPVSGGPKYSTSTVSSLVDPLPGASPNFAPSPVASAVELARAFSRSSSTGSARPTGVKALRSPPPYFNGVSGFHRDQDAHFSRLAEPSPPRNLGEEGGSFPGKRGLPIRRTEGYLE